MHGSPFVKGFRKFSPKRDVNIRKNSSKNFRKILGKSVINANKTFHSLAFLAFFSALIFTLRQTLLPRIIIALAATLYLLYMLYRSKWLLAEKNAGAKS
jgi:uncharacterized membrane protein YcfT